MEKLGKKLRLGILISGRGSNMAALIEATKNPAYPAEIVLVISNIADAPGLTVAAAAGLPNKVISHRAYPDRASFDAALTAALEEAGVELVCLAGFMRILTPDFAGHWHDRLINIHPSLLPSYKGLHTHERALAAGEKEAGCTVHFVRVELDDGPIILQKRVPIMPGDTPDTLAARVLGAEHVCYPEAVRLIAEARHKNLADSAQTVQ